MSSIQNGRRARTLQTFQKFYVPTRQSTAANATSIFVQQKILYCSIIDYNQFGINISRHLPKGTYNFIYRNGMYDFNYTRISKMFKLLVAKQSVLSSVICKCKGQIVRIGLAHNRICPVIKLLTHILCGDIW